MNLAFFRAITSAQSQPSTPSMYELDSFEVDPSPLATQTLRFFEELQAKKRPFWETFCELNASDPECKVFDI